MAFQSKCRRDGDVSDATHKSVAIKVGCCDVNRTAKQRQGMYIVHISMIPSFQILAFVVIIVFLANNLASKQDLNYKSEQQLKQLLLMESLIPALQKERFDVITCNWTNDSFSRSDLSLNDPNGPSMDGQHVSRNVVLQSRLKQIRKQLDKSALCSDWAIVEDYNDLISSLLRHAISDQLANDDSDLWREMTSYKCMEKAIEHFSIASVYGHPHLCCNVFNASIAQINYIKHETIGQEFLNMSGSFSSWITPYLANVLNEDDAINRVLARQTDYFIHNSDEQGDYNNLQDYNQAVATLEKRLKELQVHILQNMVKKLTNEWQRNKTAHAIAILTVSMLLLSNMAIIFLTRRTGQNIEVIVTNLISTARRLKSERDKSDCLLDQMLPEPVSQQLKLKKEVLAESFDSVTILFSDIVEFTKMASESTPMQVISLLNDLYSAFDSCVELYDAYKVETIGDAYMVASGLPIRNGQAHASEMANVALELVLKTEVFELPHRPGQKISVRTGIHTGPCVAGVVGSKMPRYCLFGDTINTASRMESTGEAGKIHISQTTKEALEVNSKYRIVPRSTIEVKGKGLMRTFWLIGKRSEDQLSNPHESVGQSLEDSE